VEIFESMSTLVFWRKQYRTDSGGAGTFRGGLGQQIEIGNALDEPFVFYSSFERTKFAARGGDGGHDGALGVIRTGSGERLAGKGTFSIDAGTRLHIESPGGGGIGEPLRRSRDAVARDLVHGLISAEAARDIYGFDPDDPGSRTPIAAVR
jgi:N-methylhydantoinase B